MSNGVAFGLGFVSATMLFWLMLWTWGLPALGRWVKRNAVVHDVYGEDGRLLIVYTFAGNPDRVRHATLDADPRLVADLEE